MFCSHEAAVFERFHTEGGEMKVVYGEDAQSYEVVKQWHGQFKCGRTSVETVPIPGHPLFAIYDDTIQQSEIIILNDRRVTERPVKKWASSRENLSSGFSTKRVSNQSPKLQRLARKMKFRL